MALASKYSDVLQTYTNFFEHFHTLFPLSCAVDFLLLLLEVKPCLRTRVKDYARYQSDLTHWCSEFCLFHVTKYEDFFYLSRDRDVLHQAAQIDHFLTPHEKSFGHLMGYPTCCCEKIAEIGEENIDLYESLLIQEAFAGEFLLINPQYYREGRALISHVPCSSNCLPSLEQAKQVVNFIRRSRETSVFRAAVSRDHLLRFLENLVVQYTAESFPKARRHTLQ